MEKFMRKMPTISVMVALIIQVGRVADFGDRIGAGLLAWVFAVFLAGSIYGLAYWQGRAQYTVTADPADKARYAAQMRTKRLYDQPRKVATRWLIAFVIIDGGLNLAETMSALPAGVTMWQYGGAVAYGAFPTLAAMGLGQLQSYIEKMPTVSQKSALGRMFDAWMRRMEQDANAGAPDATHGDAPMRRSASHSNAYPKACPHGCGAQLQNANAYTAHVGRWCPKIRIPASQVPPFDKVKVDAEGER